MSVQEKVEERELDYGGTAKALNSTQFISASLDDILYMDGLAEDLRVCDVISNNAYV